MKKPLQIFRPGSHLASGGQRLDFSESDVLATINAYDPAKHEAPIVVGHPKHDDPAYGWVAALSFDEGAVCAESSQVDPAFAEMVAAGRFKKISASFYEPNSPSNPVPGVYYLRHVGFLGGQPPAVKGLRDASFNDGDDQVITLEFSESSYGWQVLARMFRGIREFIISSHGQEKADEVLPNWDVDYLKTIAEQENKDAAAPAFGEPEQKPQLQGGDMAKTKEEIEALETENTRLKQEKAAFSEREAKLAEAEKKQHNTANADFCESLVKDGVLHPGQKGNAAAVLNALSTDERPVDFSEGNKTEAKPIAEAFKAFLSAQPKLVDFKEAGRGNVVAADMEDPQIIANKAVEFVESEAKAGRTVSVVEAVQRVVGQAAQA